MHNLMDSEFFGMPGANQYRHEVFPDVFANGRPVRLENWEDEDIEMYVTGLPKEK